MPAVKRVKRIRQSPRTQIAFGTLVMMAGAYLIALWMVGIVVVVGGLLFCLDGLFRDAAVSREFGATPIDRWRNAA